jgi:hypothetical protein
MSPAVLFLHRLPPFAWLTTIWPTLPNE